MTKHIYTFALLALVMVTSCGSKATKHEYSDAITRYLESTVELKVASGGPELIIIPLNACSPCVKTTMQDLLSLDQDKPEVRVVLSGFSGDDEIEKLATEMQTEYDCLVDPSDGLRLYRTNISAPVLIKTKKDFIVDMIDLSKIEEGTMLSLL